MADIKRVNYFTHQFLVEKDFDDEQDYHIDMRRRHNRVNHSWGVAEGLDVTKTENKKVTISPGMSIDKDGQEIVLLEPLPVDLTAFGSNTDVYLSISYQEVFDEADHYTSGGVNNYTRTTERPEIEGKMAVPPGDGSVITLARVHLDGSGNVVEIANSVRTLVGSKIAPGAVSTNELSDGAVTEQKLAKNAVSSAKIAEADGKTGQNANTGEGVKTEHLQNEAVTGAKIANNTISDTKLDASTRKKLVTNGNNHDHYEGNGAQIKHSTLSKNDGRNPHGTTAADVGALVSVDGVRNPGGNVDLVRSNAITITPNDAQNRITIGENHSARTNNPHQVSAAQSGALPTTGGNVSGFLSVHRNTGHGTVAVIRNNSEDGTMGLLALVNPPSSISYRYAAVAARSYRSNVHGVYAAAPSGTHALYVSGTSQFTGAKSGYVVDAFVNASGQILRTGDVVKLKGTPVVHFQGDGNKIPVAEVSLADKENDNMAIGIVDREAIPEPDAPDNRVDPDDPTFIEDGGELFVVTLGAYAHCKVDATEAPIQVGDLLTSSSNPGHAKKATDPKIGCIIGKALEPLREETGYIAVFVNIQ